MSEVYDIAFIGDSLIQKPSCDSDLFGKIRRLLGSFDVRIYSFAKGGATIRTVRNRQLELALATYPKAVLLFWDSDVSDIDESDMDDYVLSQTRNNYRKDLEYVIGSIVNKSILMAVGGPSLLGEGPLFRATAYPRKQAMLLDYVRINEEVTSQFNNTYASGVSTRVPYMNLRQDFLDSMSSYWKANGYFKCALTLDGEHPNEAGADIIARRFASTIQQLFDPSIYTVSAHQYNDPVVFGDDDPFEANIPKHCHKFGKLNPDYGLHNLETCLTYESLVFVVFACGVLAIFLIHLRLSHRNETLKCRISLSHRSILSVTEICNVDGVPASMDSSGFEIDDDNERETSSPILKTNPIQALGGIPQILAKVTNNVGFDENEIIRLISEE